jgi:hypothetical protein
VIVNFEIFAAYPLDHFDPESDELLSVLGGSKAECFVFLERECPRWKTRLPWAYRVPESERFNDRAFRCVMEGLRDNDEEKDI